MMNGGGLEIDGVDAGNISGGGGGWFSDAIGEAFGGDGGGCGGGGCGGGCGGD
jgi:hypothetical protein